MSQYEVVQHILLPLTLAVFGITCCTAVVLLRLRSKRYPTWVDDEMVVRCVTLIVASALWWVPAGLYCLAVLVVEPRP